MTWLEPMWLAYPTAALLVLTVLFALSVRWTLKAHPVPVLNYAYERLYEKPRATYAPTNLHQVWAASASSSVAYIPGAVWYVDNPEQIMRLPSVERYA